MFALAGLLVAQTAVAGSPRVGARGTTSTTVARRAATGGGVRARTLSRGLPVRFEANRGQTDPQVRFLSRGHGHTLFLTPSAAVVALRAPRRSSQRAARGLVETTSVRMQWVGAQADPVIDGREPLAGKTSVLRGDSPEDWHTDIPAYARVRYESLYPGIDLDFHADRGRLEYDFTLAAGADVDAIRLRFAGATGIEIDRGGDLVLHTAAGDLLQRAPDVYQEIDGRRRGVPGRYVLTGSDQVGFVVGAHDPDEALVIDPVMVFSTFFGGTGFDTAYGVAVDAAGAIYVTGWDGSADFPTSPGSLQSSPAGGYVAKLAPGGQRLVYAALIPTIGKDIAVDSQGDAWVTSDFDGLGGALYELAADGSSLRFSQRLDGGAATGVAVDSSDNVYVVGEPASDFEPTADAFQATPGASSPMAFVTKLDSSGNVVYASYLGNGGDSARDVAVDGDGVAYVTGYTLSGDFPTRNAFQHRSGGNYDAFVTAVEPDGTALRYSTYLGGGQEDFAEGIAVDGFGSAYVTGRTFSFADFPVASPFQSQLQGGENAFVTKLAPDGRSLVYSTYLGGGEDEAYGIAVDIDGSAAVVGRTRVENFPVLDALQMSFEGPTDAFVTRLNGAGSGLIYSTYLGGSLTDQGWAIAVDGTGGVYAVGETKSYDFPTASPLQPTNPMIADSDAFITEISDTAAAGPTADVAVTIDDSADPVSGGASLEYAVTYTNTGPDPANGIASLIRLDRFATFVSVSATQGSCSTPNTLDQISCDLGSLASGDSATVSVAIEAPDVDSGAFGSDVFVTADEYDPAIANDADRESTLIASQGQSFTLDVSVTGNGSVASFNVAGIDCPGDCSESYPDGQGVILKANPAAGSAFDHWAGDCSGTGDCSVTMSADHAVTAVFSDEPVSTDTVSITRAEYDDRKGELRVEATSSEPSATLQAFVTSSGALIGTLDHRGGTFRGRFDLSTNPGSITVRSSSGGSDSASVTVK